MVYIAEISFARGLISKEMLENHRRILERVGLPVSLPQSFTIADLPALILAMQRDKKVKAGKVRFVALHEGKELTRLDDVNAEELALAYEKVLL
jgi:3-dehydroquinate synthase